MFEKITRFMVHGVIMIPFIAISFFSVATADALTIAQGTAIATNTSSDATLIAAQGAGKTLRLFKGTCIVKTAATGGSGEFAIEDGVGGTRVIEGDADAVDSFNFDFSPSGYALSANTAMNLTVDNASTTQADTRCTVIAKV